MFNNTSPKSSIRNGISPSSTLAPACEICVDPLPLLEGAGAGAGWLVTVTAFDSNGICGATIATGIDLPTATLSEGLDAIEPCVAEATCIGDEWFCVVDA
jgi:hypothetical protein